MEKNLSYSLFMIDIDNFRKLNDTNGHVVGDLFLKEISHRLRNYDQQILSQEWAETNS